MIDTNSAYKLIDLELNRKGNDYSLRAVYRYESRYATKELIYPNIKLPIKPFNKPIIKYDFGPWVDETNITIDIGFGPIPLNCGYVDELHPSVQFVERNITNEDVYEMTLDEIENVLGYKIKIKED